MPQVPKDGLDQNMLCSGIPHPVHLQHLPFDGHGRVKAKRQSLCFIELEDHKRPGNRRQVGYFETLPFNETSSRTAVKRSPELDAIRPGCIRGEAAQGCVSQSCCDIRPNQGQTAKEASCLH